MMHDVFRCLVALAAAASRSSCVTGLAENMNFLVGHQAPRGEVVIMEIPAPLHHTLCLGFALSINGLHLGRNDHHLTFCHTTPIGYWEPKIRYGNGDIGAGSHRGIKMSMMSWQIVVVVHSSVQVYGAKLHDLRDGLNNQTIWGCSWQLVSRCFFSDWFVAVQICQMVSLATPLERLQHQSPHRFDAWKRPLHLIIRSFWRCGFGRNARRFSFRIRIFACSCSQPTPVFCRSAVDQLSCFTGYSPIAPYASCGRSKQGT